MAAWLSIRVIAFLCVHFVMVEMFDPFRLPIGKESLVDSSFNALSSNKGTIDNSGTFNKGFNNNSLAIGKREARNELLERAYEHTGSEWHKDLHYPTEHDGK